MNVFKIIGRDSRYEISQTSLIRCVKTLIVKKQYIGSTGYYMISISRNNKSKPYRVHVLLAEAFIPNPKNYRYINHIDGNKLNNELSNLEWCTHDMNMKHAFRTGLVNNTGESNGMSKLTVEKVRQIKKWLLEGHSQYWIARKLGSISRSAILKIKIGKTWAHVSAGKPV
jgi:hypothetical protein